MTWLPILALAAIAFLVAAFVLRLPRNGWALLGAVLMLGLAGYAMQGSPGLPDAPANAREQQERSGEILVSARRALFDSARPPADYIILSDGFARRGQFSDAANLLRRKLVENPEDAEAWLAMANALVEHADGQVTPAALEAYERAQAAYPEHPGAALFLGSALLRSGDLKGTREVWAELLSTTPADAPWRAELEFRLARLDEVIAQMESQAANR